MRREVFDYFRIAGLTAQSKNDGINPKRHFMLGSVGVRNDGAIVKSSNGPTQVPSRHVHAEKKLCQKLDYGATVYVARVKYSDGSFGCSRPCPNCFRALAAKKVKKVFYTIDNRSYGVINIEKMEEKIVLYKPLEI